MENISVWRKNIGQLGKNHKLHLATLVLSPSIIINILLTRPNQLGLLIVTLHQTLSFEQTRSRATALCLLVGLTLRSLRGISNAFILLSFFVMCFCSTVIKVNIEKCRAHVSCKYSKAARTIVNLLDDRWRLYLNSNRPASGETQPHSFTVSAEGKPYIFVVAVPLP